MKKVAVSAFLFACGVFANGAICADGDVISDVDNALVDQSNSSTNKWNAYMGLGIGGNFLENKFDASSNIPGFYKPDKVNVNRFIGTIFLGVGRFFENGLYAGIEFLTDFGKSTTKDLQWNGQGVWKSHMNNPAPNGSDFEVNSKIKSSAVLPQLAFKVGYRYGSYMFYGKIGGSYSKYTIKDMELKVTNKNTNAVSIYKFGEKSKSGIVPTLVLGCIYQKCKCGFGAEVEYRFRKKDDYEGPLNTKISIKANEGWTVRGFATYAVNFGQ